MFCFWPVFGWRCADPEKDVVGTSNECHQGPAWSWWIPQSSARIEAVPRQVLWVFLYAHKQVLWAAKHIEEKDNQAEHKLVQMHQCWGVTCSFSQVIAITFHCVCKCVKPINYLINWSSTLVDCEPTVEQIWEYWAICLIAITMHICRSCAKK